MAHPNSYPNQNTGNRYQHGDDGVQGGNSDQMFNALINQYIAQTASSSSSTGSSLQGHGRAQASRSPSWSASTQNTGYPSLSGSGQPGMPIPGSGPSLQASQQPTFSDLMREMSHEQSLALHEAARRAPYRPVSATPSSQGNPQQGLTSPGDYLYAPPAGMTHATPLPNSRSPSGSISGGSTGAQRGTTEDDASLFEMFPCDMCSASFSRRHDLERHRRGHSGEAPYTCEGCGGAFTRSDGRGRHWKLQPACEVRHFERGGMGKRRSGAAAPGPGDPSAGIF